MRWMVVVVACIGCLDPTQTNCDDGTICPADRVCIAGGACATQDQLVACANKSDGDACSFVNGFGVCRGGVCIGTLCGNGVVDPGEICDPGTDPTSCRQDCLKAPVCGDKILDAFAGEECDDGNTAAGDGCSPTCKVEICGNGILDPGEVCDDHNTNSGDGCRGDCRSDEKCGNGKVDFASGEQCDDGNLRGQDGCSSTCQIEIPAWRELPVSPPPAIGNAAIAYDASRGRLVMFGGEGLVGGPGGVVGTGELDTTLEWDTYRWTQIPLVTRPPPRTSTAMAYDAARHRVVMFGGAFAGNNANDTWEWNGAAWHQIVPVTSPTPRNDHALAYDAAHDVVVMFGGLQAASETWLYDGQTWTLASTVGPPPILGPGMAYDARRGRVVLFGGAVNGVGLNTSTWAWDGTSWQDITPALSPPGCFPCNLVYDARRDRIVLFDSSLLAPATWEFDGSTWQDVTPSSSPSRRAGIAMAYDVARGTTVFVGGSDQFNAFADTFEWDGSTWTKALAPIGPSGPTAYDVRRGRVVATDSQTTVEWDGLGWTLQLPTDSPTPNSSFALAYDEGRGNTVMVAGAGIDFPFPVAETWTWDGTDWTHVTAADGEETADSGINAVYDAALDRVVMPGGGSTALWDGSSWTTVNAAPVNFVGTPGVSYDAVNERVVQFGGDATRGQGVPTGTNDTLLFDGVSWTLLAPPVRPPPRATTAIAYDPGRRKTVLFGGAELDGQLADTWEFDGATWSELHPVSIPNVSAAITAVYDARNEAVMQGNFVLRWESDTPHEVCELGFDVDGDGLVGCADPDCWALCTPHCPPNGPCDPAASHCGDGVCDPVETCRVCPQDCGACTPICGDFLCDPGETAATCPGDCTH